MDDPTHAQLRWRCRRGMKELDMLLGAWLDRRWPEADPDRRRAFQWLLEQPDSDLADWLIGGQRPVDALHAALVDDIVRRRD
jgi:antitoxin CptB